jgi:serpin B
MTFIAMVASSLHAANTTSAASGAVNSLGIDLLAKIGRTDGKPVANALISPYSIQTALAMTYAGADGRTRDEMEKTLHFPKDEAALDGSFAELQKELREIEQSPGKISEDSKRYGGPAEPITLSVANRLFGEQDGHFLEPFLGTVKDYYGAPLETVDFSDPAQATEHINAWVAGETHERIQDLIPKGALDSLTSLVLVNAIYMKAGWAVAFDKNSTTPKPFHVNEAEAVDVPTMQKIARFGYAKHEGYTAVALFYIGSELQFVVLLPDDANGLAALESKLNAAILADCAHLEEREVSLSLPKLKFEPPTVDLKEQLKALGMVSAFDESSANFGRMNGRHDLYVKYVFHKTFLALDENGTEAAAATAVVMAKRAVAVEGESPVEVHVDRPFLFAIQDRKSGACLFLGRVTDPR